MALFIKQNCEGFTHVQLLATRARIKTQ